MARAGLLTATAGGSVGTPATASSKFLVNRALGDADEVWQVQRRYFRQESMGGLYEPQLDQLGKPTPLSFAPVR